jgi:thiamine-monophosphate kinase
VTGPPDPRQPARRGSPAVPTVGTATIGTASVGSAAVGTASTGGERAAVERIKAMLALPAVGEIGIGDDAAVVTAPGGGAILLTADLVVGGVHVDLAFSSPSDIGWKAVAVNVSDIAAMGGRPLHGLVSIVKPSAIDLDALYAGLSDAAYDYGCTIVGGDLSAGDQLVVAIAMTGTTEDRSPVLRSGARPGDTLFVTGPLGGSAAGLAALREDPHASGDHVDAHRRPVARVDEGRAAALSGASAMIDISDGLASELDLLARASGVGIALDHVATVHGATIAEALSGGEDYELLFSAGDADAIVAGFEHAGLRRPIRVGRCVEDRDVRTLDGEQLDVTGFEHRLG